MESGFEKILSPSKSAASSRGSITGFRENNENDSIVISNLMNENKTVSKHLIPPTNKILLDRNGNSTTEILSEFDSPEKVYDPDSNYLCPRPKYLRFNPDRRHEVFNSLEKEGIDLNGFLGSRGISDKEEYNGIDGCEDEDEDEEEEKGRGWCVGLILKLVVTLISCWLSMSYICTMNSSTSPSPYQKSLWELKDGYLMLHKQAMEVINMKMFDVGLLGAVEEVDGNSYEVDKEVSLDEGENGSEVDSESTEEMTRLHDSVNELHKIGLDNAVEMKEVEWDEVDEEEDGLESKEEPDRLQELSFDNAVAEHQLEKLVDVEEEDSLDQLVEELNELHNLSDELNKTGIDNAADEQQLEKLLEVEDEDSLDLLTEELNQSHDLGDELSETGLDTACLLYHELRSLVHIEIEKLGWDTAAVGLSLGLILISTVFIFIYRAIKAKRVSMEPQEEKRVKFLARPSPYDYDKGTPEGILNYNKGVPKELLDYDKGVSKGILNYNKGVPKELIDYDQGVAKEVPVYNKGLRKEFYNYNTHPPTVELIEEIVVGQVNSSSYRSNKFTSSLESEAVPMSGIEYSSASHINTTNIHKKEGGKREEVINEVLTTPVRRSSRLRNRSQQ